MPEVLRVCINYKMLRAESVISFSNMTITDDYAASEISGIF